MKTIRLLVYLTTGLAASLSARAQALPGEVLRDGEARQQTLAGDVQRLITQLDAMLGEYSRNDIGGDDAKTLQAVRDSLRQLSDAEMKRIAELLQGARAAKDPGAAREKVGQAFAAQKNIVVEMQKLITRHRRNMQALDIARSISALADRQAANLQNGIALGKWTGGKKPADDAALKANLEGQATEQAALAEELRVVHSRLAEFAKADPDLTNGTRIMQALEDAQQIGPQAEAAAAALKDGQLFKAVADEKAARDAMRKLARAVAPQQAPSEMLRKAERELAKIAEAQRELGENAAKLAKSKNDMAGELAALEDAQADLAAQSDMLAQDLELPARAAADAVKGALGAMQESRGALADQKPADSVQNAQAALAKLAEARAEVTKQSALARIAEGKLTGNRAQDAMALQQAAQLLAQQQAAAAQNADKSGQAALAQRGEQLAGLAGQAGSPAAGALQQGAQAAQQAAQAAQAGQMAQAAQAQQQAAEQFAQAAQQMAQAAQQAAQAQEKAQQVRKAADEMTEIIKAEQALERDTARATAKKAKDEETFLRLAISQGEIRDRTRSFSRTVVSFAPNIAFESAEINMGTAHRDLEKADGPEARKYEQKAIAGLYEAQKSLEKLAEETARIAGELADENRAAQAAQQLAAAQQALQQAMAATDPAAQDGLLMEAAEQAGNAAAVPGEAQAAAQAAAQALSNALAGNPAAAQSAAQSLAAAQAAMSQSMSGLSQASGSGQPQSQPGRGGATGYQPSEPEAVERDSRLAPAKRVSFTGLPPRERAVIEQAQGEKAPEEFGALVEQYLRNLADESAKK